MNLSQQGVFSRRLADFPVLFRPPAAGAQLSWDALPGSGQRPQRGCCCCSLKHNHHFALVADYAPYISIVFAFIFPPSQWHLRFLFNFFQHPCPLLSLPTQPMAVPYFFICFQCGVFTEQHGWVFFPFLFSPRPFVFVLKHTLL